MSLDLSPYNLAICISLHYVINVTLHWGSWHIYLPSSIIFPPQPFPLHLSQNENYYIIFPYLEAIRHGLSEPDMLLLTDVLADVPVLQRNAGTSWADAGLTRLHVAEDLDGIQRRSLVGIHPVGTFSKQKSVVMSESLKRLGINVKVLI